MAAGQGFKTFTTGEVLTAGDVNGYLMQGINVFASSSARSAAITSPQEGQYSYLKDTNALEYYDGSAWVGAPVGDITAVTAGKGLTGGGSSGDVTVSLATTAKGDLVAGSGASTAAVLTVGNNGETLVADSSTSTGLRYQGNYAAGKNKIINGDFGIWQRGTSFTMTTATTYCSDHWRTYRDGTGATVTVSRQTFTPGAAPVAGYETNYFFRFNQSVAGTGGTYSAITQPIEDVTTFAGQTITISFYAKADAARTVQVAVNQNFGSGGSGGVSTYGTNFTLSTSWTRYSTTISVPSISSKTIGTGSYLDVQFLPANNTAQTLDFALVQAEAGSVATAFQTATGTIQGELAACQRYYEKSYEQATAPATATYTGCIDKYIGVNVTGSGDQIYYRVTKRVAPTVTIYSTTGSAASGKIWSNSLASDLTITGGSNGQNGYSFYWSQTSAGLNVSYQFVASAEL